MAKEEDILYEILDRLAKRLAGGEQLSPTELRARVRGPFVRRTGRAISKEELEDAVADVQKFAQEMRSAPTPRIIASVEPPRVKPPKPKDLDSPLVDKTLSKAARKTRKLSGAARSRQEVRRMATVAGFLPAPRSLPRLPAPEGWVGPGTTSAASKPSVGSDVVVRTGARTVLPGRGLIHSGPGYGAPIGPARPSVESAGAGRALGFLKRHWGTMLGLGLAAYELPRLVGRFTGAEDKRMVRAADRQLSSQLAVQSMGAQSAMNEARLQDIMEKKAALLSRNDPALAMTVLGMPELTDREWVIGARPKTENLKNLLRSDAVSTLAAQ